MDSNQDYDRKFEEMKKYIPFLESMIKRLESTGVPSGNNPRQAQLDKIRSLRDLLLDKKKRMKMENLLKCEQVLVNLYVKVEQRDTKPKLAPTSTEKSTAGVSDFNTVRNKLKSVAIRMDETMDTLPEIARAHDLDVSTSGSKEPALFQRRPNKLSKSPISSPVADKKSSSPQSLSKRNYTRVLLSPDPSEKRWDKSSTIDKPLFSRRSPRRSPKRYSPSYNKKERKKMAKRSNVDSNEQRKDWNITLNVPEESLNSLNTKDILSRIINCSDRDVDIDTLRELRTQILGELKETGASDDISDLILKSYKKKKDTSVTRSSKEEVEEGELSDSESEAIESIYSSLVVVDQNESSVSEEKTSLEKDQPRKIQICLVINADKDDDSKSCNKNNLNDQRTVDISDFEMFSGTTGEKKTAISVYKKSDKSTVANDKNELAENKETNIEEVVHIVQSKTENRNETIVYGENSSQDQESQGTLDTDDRSNEIISEPRKFKANFYKPLTEQGGETKDPSVDTSDKPKVDNRTVETSVVREITVLEPSDSKNDSYEQENKDVEIPLLNDRPIPTEPPKNPTVSEIEILQALKNEILSETISLSGSEMATPALHLPKVLKVANAKEILPKKRISIENYKQKSVSTKSKHSLYLNDDPLLDQNKKPSLKLTEKECERFNLTKLAMDDDDISEDDDLAEDDIYGDLAPKSPDNEEPAELPTASPVIIPVDPVKVTTDITKLDVDMRTLLPHTVSSPIESLSIKDKFDAIKCEPNKIDRTPLTDPRMRRDIDISLNLDTYPERTPRPTQVPGFSAAPSIMSPNITPTMKPSVMPDLNPSLMPTLNPTMMPGFNPAMTPNSRTFEMTPSHQSLDIDSNNKHVYAPVFTDFKPREIRGQSVVNDLRRDKTDNQSENQRYRQNSSTRWDDPRSNSVQRDIEGQKSGYGDTYKHKKAAVNERYRIDRRNNRSECSPTPHSFNRYDSVNPSFGSKDAKCIHPFGRLDLRDCPNTPSPSFGRSDCPSTPNHPFGRSDCPATPGHPFGRSDCPATPSHPFGRSDCPATPSHPFGRSECPTTSSHSFSRSECPSTPIHPFGRNDMTMTPSHPYGRSDSSQSHSHNKFYKDPRINRPSDYDNAYKDIDSEYYKDYSFDQVNSYRIKNRSYHKPDYRYDRERDQKRHYTPDHYSRYNSREAMYRREQMNTHDYEDERRRSRSGGYYRNENVKSFDDVGTRRHFQRERSIGRNMPDDRFGTSKMRATSVGRNLLPEPEGDNMLSVNRDAGRSFTINTSVNATFQDVLAAGNEIQKFDCSFDARRQRAASVGRSLTRESSTGSPLFHSKSKNAKQASGENNRESGSRRACSVGRELSSSNMNQTLNEIKADFETYSKSIKMPFSSESKIQERGNLESNEATDQYPRKKNIKNADGSTKTDIKPPYSPTKNYRDPRMRREMYNDHKRRDNKYNQDWRDQKKHGIVYSNDNIAKGTILGSGYGVKNYKIPKIKRSVEEKVEEKEKVEFKEEIEITDVIEKKDTEIVTEELDKNVDGSKSIKTDSKSRKGTKAAIKDDLPETRVTRSKKLLTSEAFETKNVMNLRKNRKAIIYDSESESESVIDDQHTVSENSNTVCPSPDGNKISDEKIEADQSESLSSFCVDDLDMFPENIVSDPVLDNINALIADLDNDIDTTKNDTEDSASEFTNELTLENMLDNISSTESEEQPPKILTMDAIQETGNDNTSTAINASLDSDQEILLKTPSNKEDASSVENTFQSTEAKKEDSDKLELSKKVSGNEDIVSTTDAEPREQIKLDVLDDRSYDDCSTPDSTITTNEAILEKAKEKEGSADSTINNVQSEMNSDVSSTHSIESIRKEPDESHHSSHSDNIPALESFGSLLSILRNKSKIKELLGMLGQNSSGNEKIKKKLVKLSEIVSDEEDTGDGGDKDDSLNGSKEAEHSRVTEKNGYNTEQLSTEHLPGNNEHLLSNTEQPPGNTERPLSNSKQLSGNIELLPSSSNLECKLEHSDNATIVQLDSCETSLPSTEITAETVYDKSSLTENDNIVQPDPNTSEDIKSAENETNDNIEEKNDNVAIANLCIPKDDTDEQKIENIVKDSALNFGENKTDAEAKDEAVESNLLENTQTEKKKPAKKPKFVKKGKGKKVKKSVQREPKRVTRLAVGNTDKTSTKKPSRELLKLQEDVKDMFKKGDALNTSGIRMCRLAKMVEDTSAKDIQNPDSEPVVILEKFKNTEKSDNVNNEKPNKKKLRPKPKPKSTIVEYENKEERLNTSNNKPGPRSKIQRKPSEVDPYEFEMDSLDTNTSKASDVDNESSSDSENESLASSIGSTEVLSDVKKKKRKRPGWKAGVIKSKKRKMDKKLDELPVPIPVAAVPAEHVRTPSKLPDLKCFVDKDYSFEKNTFTYSCRLCVYFGTEIVHHYKNNHPHSEVPISRLNSTVANEAIEQCEHPNFQNIMKIPTERYVCRFCSNEFGKTKSALERFFWHVVSMHTGEYKKMCSECDSAQCCPFSMDIPPPPQDDTAQLLAFICGKCNFTQISLENLKTHVILRHNDEETVVYAISLSEMSKKAISDLNKPFGAAKVRRVLRSLRAQQSLSEASEHIAIAESSRKSDCPSPERKLSVAEIPTIDEKSEIEHKNIVSVQSQITFETDENNEVAGHVGPVAQINVKTEPVEENYQAPIQFAEHTEDEDRQKNPTSTDEPIQRKTFSDGVIEYPHFKLSRSDSGTKEYVCCINGVDNHYTTTLLISMKRHIQTKHTEQWDGYCFLCKVIVTPQGIHNFKDCLQHYLDKHIDDIPVLEKRNKDDGQMALAANVRPILDHDPPSGEKPSSPRSLINVRPLAELIVNDVDTAGKVASPLPKIESVISLGSPRVDPTQSPMLSPAYPTTSVAKQPEKQFTKYEEAQAVVMAKKHRVVLEAMMTKEKLLQVFKCAGRYCSFTSDLVEESLLHASTHHRIGGVDSLNCSYCDFDSSGNAIDLVMHVFKVHGRCQYSCRHCFYRGAASQLVAAHMSRKHGAKAVKSPVLRTTHVSQPVGPDVAGMLTRSEAVSYFVCGHGSNGVDCPFRTFTVGKYYEHLQQRHSSAVAHPCQDCSMQFPSAIQLADHTKCHNYKLYQCAWCVHGADKETDLLEHASTYHPGKPPQAYMRIITNKDGSLEQRVLPLVCLNKANVLTEDVNPSSNRENPVREAERSIDLEKLIGDTMLIEFAESLTNPEAPLVEEPINIPDAFSDVADTGSTNPSVADAPIESLLTEVPPRIVTPPPVTDSTLELTPIVKTEPELTASVDKLNNVVCLDSDDEEDTLKTTIDLSVEDDTGTTKVHDNMKRFQKIADQLLYKCPLCEVLFSTENDFKKHSCLTLCRAKKLITCPHCQAVVMTIMDLLRHYKNNHCSNHYICEVCEKSFSTLTTTKKHMAAAHKKIKNIYCQCVGYSDGVKRYIVSKNPNIVPLNRKLSVETSVKSFGPQDVDKLPINPIMDSPVFCAVCKFNTKVRLNMVRHLQLHAEQQPAPNTAPVNPVPHLETNEMHFDRMLNLASSSLSARAASAGPAPAAPAAPAGDRYPKFVPDRQRYTCGARGCSYTSIDETMLRCHWVALHADCQDFVCTHCPPQQCMDRTRPLSAARIIAHLNMHDAALYGCSLCSYYHNLRKLVDKHLNDVHKGGQVIVIREDGKNVTSSQPPPASSTAPTMDLKPWQCGLCEFKSMLRPAVVEHCTKVHHSKMQFKCAYCPFRTSAKENVTKHQQHSHPERSEEVFYYYYREGSIPDEGGVPRWRKQVQKNPDTQTEVKTEVPDVTSTPQTPVAIPPTPPPLVVDLNLVKMEVDAECEKDDTIEQLTAKYGQVCEPNGIRFKCPLCKVVSEDTPDAMQSHLYEELKYRKWSCAICAYKAFHSTGLKEHMASEHGRAAQEPIQLPPDVNIERWVAKHIEHQAAIIKSTKEKLCLQKAEVPKTTEHKAKENPQESSTSQKEISETELINAFGPFGNPSFMMYTCPKCSQVEKDPAVMRDHLETELSKIRWCCSECPTSFQTYHEAQYHCRCAHPRGARPVGAARDPALRAAWLRGVLRHQAALLQARPAPRSPDPDENSLLVVRYEVPAAGESPPRRKRPAPSTSDDDRRPDEDCPQKKKIQCLYCNYTTTYPNTLKQHTVRHYNLKPYTCPYCNVTASRLAVQRHIELSHPGRPVRVVPTEVPDEPPTNISLAYKRAAKNLDEESVTKMQCLYCEKLLQENEMTAHTHEGIKPEFAKVGAVVVKCCICQQLKLHLESLQEHHSAAHPHTAVNYSFFKVKCEPREVFQCCHCSKKFVYLKDLMSHHNATHLYASVKYLILTVSTSANSVDKAKRRSLNADIPGRKRIAKKSTTKLPMNTVAKKSTTKLPTMTYESDSEEEYSFYGNSPTPLEKYANVTTFMPFFNNMVPFTLKKLRDIIEIDPKVLVKDCFKQ